MPWREWLLRRFPSVCSAPLGERHVRLWEWFESLTPGVRPRARVDVWPRGGAKSSTAELGVARVGVKLTRRFVLYVSETQDQADLHVQSIGALFDTLGVDRALGRYGASKGWRRDQLRTANGFNVAAYGLDSASRGVKLDQFRPDLIIFDDLDRQSDSTRTVEKKIAAITTSVLPTGSVDCATLAIQNLIHEEGIFAQLVDGRADFLHDRAPAQVEPAVRGLKVETYDPGDGIQRYRITEGEPTWAGQGLATCERQINEWGLAAFKREAQHEVAGAQGYVFDVSCLQYCEADEVPPGLRWCRAWDLAATEGGGDATAGVRVGIVGTLPDVRVYLTDVREGHWGPDKVSKLVSDTAKEDGPRVRLHLPQDPGQAGKAQVNQYKRSLKEETGIQAASDTVSGKKWVRARGIAEQVNKGNVWVVRASWNARVKDVLRKFREKVLDQDDDIVDALSDAYNEAVRPRLKMGAT